MHRSGANLQALGEVGEVGAVLLTLQVTLVLAGEAGAGGQVQGLTPLQATPHLACHPLSHRHSHLAARALARASPHVHAHLAFDHMQRPSHSTGAMNAAVHPCRLLQLAV